MRKKALITGVAGQDGSYLAELLIAHDYEVLGIVRRTSNPNFARIEHLYSSTTSLRLIEGDVSDPWSMQKIIGDFQPHEIYNLAAMSHVHSSFEQPKYTFDVDALGVLNILEAMRSSCPTARLYQASTSEMFGTNFSRDPNTAERFQDENTPFCPQSPYAIAKLAAHNLVGLYRSSYNLFACSGILFNHESPRRGETFVTRKITNYVRQLNADSHFSLGDRRPRISLSYPKLKLGNLDAYRDWGHAADYCQGMLLMLQQPEPQDFVLATGKAHSVREFLDFAFRHTGFDSWEEFVEIDPQFIRPAEVPYLRGDASKAKALLGWEPTLDFQALVDDMVING